MKTPILTILIAISIAGCSNEPSIESITHCATLTSRYIDMHTSIVENSRRYDLNQDEIDKYKKNKNEIEPLLEKILTKLKSVKQQYSQDRLNTLFEDSQNNYIKNVDPNDFKRTYKWISEEVNKCKSKF
jgi:hypothetical protein